MRRDAEATAHASADAAADAAIDRVLREWVQQPLAPLPELEARRLRQRTLAAIDARRDALTRGRRVRRAALGFAAAAGVGASVAIGAVAGRGQRAVALRAPSVVAVAGNAELIGLRGIHAVDAKQTSIGPDDELRTGPQSAARASLSTGAVVDVGSSSRLRFLEAGDGRAPRDRIELAAGNIEVRVPKLPEGGELRVLAQGITVVVHGTRFSVAELPPDSSGLARTRVAVTEGRVSVSAGGIERFLTAGDVWVGTDGAPPADERVTAPGADDAPSGDDRSTSSGVSPSATDGSSTLAAENALLTEAMGLRRSRQSQRAVAVLDELIDRYPRSPLGETAYVERLHALEDIGDARRLVREARVYLARYPHGFARAEASRVLADAAARAH